MAGTASEKKQAELDGLVFLAVLFLLALAVALWVAHTRLMMTQAELIEMLIYAGLFLWGASETISYYITIKSKLLQSWPKHPKPLSLLQDRKFLQEAEKTSSTFLGLDSSNNKPFFLPPDQRVMQSIAFGATGMGKTSQTLSMAQQDMKMGHTLIFMDGKGEKKSVDALIAYAASVGRLGDVRLLDPQHPYISSAYNIFHCPDGDIENRASSIFLSFKKKNGDPFFDEHQLAYLINVVRIMYQLGRFNVYDVLVAAHDENIIKSLMRKLLESKSLKDFSPTKRKVINMSIHSITTNLQDKDSFIKIQGLVNSLMTFMQENLAIVTGPYDDLITFDDVIKNKLILIISLNVSVNKVGVTALGKILLQDLQLAFGNRYAHITHTSAKPHFVSVILDEFAPFAYDNFPTIINQARGSQVAFFLSLQNASQLESVGHAFRSDLANSPNNRFTLHITDPSTIKEFIEASGSVKSFRKSYSFEKSSFGQADKIGSAGTQSETYESRIKNEELIVQPRGQMHAMISDNKLGMIYKHVFIRPADEHLMFSVPPSLFPHELTLDRESNGLRLEFVDSGLATKRGINRNRK